jgi:hypothetical protein
VSCWVSYESTEIHLWELLLETSLQCSVCLLLGRTKSPKVRPSKSCGFQSLFPTQGELLGGAWKHWDPLWELDSGTALMLGRTENLGPRSSEARDFHSLLPHPLTAKWTGARGAWKHCYQQAECLSTLVLPLPVQNCALLATTHSPMHLGDTIGLDACCPWGHKLGACGTSVNLLS